MKILKFGDIWTLQSLYRLWKHQRYFFAGVRSFIDPFEGSWTKSDIDIRDNSYIELLSTDLIQDGALERMKSIFKYLPNWVGISCWHENEHESAAMWNLYLTNSEGISIQTSFRSLKSSFGNALNLHFGRIKYIDFVNKKIEESVQSRSLIATFCYKRKSYEHEREIRAMFMEDIPRGADLEKGIGAGKAFDINLKVLIENIYVSPAASPWFFDLVTHYLKRNNHQFPCIKSNLYDGALF